MLVRSVPRLNLPKTGAKCYAKVDAESYA